MANWLVLTIAASASLFVIMLLRNPYAGCGYALLGGILTGGLALGVGLIYWKYFYTPRPQRNDTDFGGLADALLLVVLIPVAGAVVGFLSGIAYAFWRERGQTE